GVFNIGKSDIKQIVGCFEEQFSVDLGNYARVFSEVRIRKSGHTNFFDHLRERILQFIRNLDLYSIGHRSVKYFSNASVDFALIVLEKKQELAILMALLYNASWNESDIFTVRFHTCKIQIVWRWRSGTGQLTVDIEIVLKVKGVRTIVK